MFNKYKIYIKNWYKSELYLTFGLISKTIKTLFMTKQFKWKMIGFILALFMAAGMDAQVTFSLKGKVLDVNQDPIIGASVLLQNTTYGTITDLDGNYTLNGSLAEGTYELSVNYIGYETKSMSVELSSGNSDQNVDITLSEDALKLDEVVVVGSGITASRRQLGNAVTTVSAKDFEKSGTSNAMTALQGRVAGARITQTTGDPAGGINISLRGVNSISGSSDPLYVIDGVIVSNSATAVTQIGNSAGEGQVGTPRLADINPNDIESMSIINGAAAAAQYGSRASNGVVLITTKRGKVGKPQITIGSSFNVNQLRKKVYISTYGKQFGFSALRLGNITGLSPAQVTANPTATTVSIVRDGAPALLATNLVDVTRYDYQDNLFRQGSGTDNYINISGGSEKSKYFASVGYMNNEGIVIGTNFKRVNARLNLDQILTSWASLNIGVSAIKSGGSDQPTGNVFWSPVNSINITNNIYNITERVNGNLKAAEPTRINPLSLETFEMEQNVNRAVSSAKLSIFPLAGLKLDIIAGLDGFSQLGTQYIPLYPYAGVNTAFYANGFASSANNISLLYNTDLNLSYNKEFGNISSNTMVGYNYQNSRVDISVSSGENIAPGFKSVNGSPNRIASVGQSRYWIDGYFAQQTFGFKDLLYVTGAARVDNSSVFSTTQRNQLYTKASVSFVPSAMDFWKNGSLNNLISSAKLRASFGEAGGVAAISPYDRFNLISSVNYLGKNTLIPNAQLAFENVAPERTREYEFGGDFGFFKDKLGLGLTYYSQKVFDLLVSKTLAPSEGGTSRLDNVGEMSNKGIELSLNANAVKTKNLSVNVFGVYSKNKNLVTKLGSPTVTLSTVSGAPAFLIQGQPASVFYGTYYAANDGNRILNQWGLEQTEKGTAVNYKPGDAIPAGSYVEGGVLYTPKRGADGLPTGTALRKIIGDPNPDFTMSFGSNIQFKKLSFGFLLDGVYGGDVFNADRRTRQGVGIGDYSERELKGELPRGYIHSIYPIEEWRIEDGSFTKLREISLGYDLPTSFIKGLGSLNISVIGRNLHSFDSYDGYDPETNAGGVSDRLRGIDFGNVPIPRTIQFAIRAGF
jgi:TonB-linked SusC/RagA family outer membrane protein